MLYLILKAEGASKQHSRGLILAGIGNIIYFYTHLFLNYKVILTRNLKELLDHGSLNGSETLSAPII